MTLFEKLITLISYIKQPAKRKMINLAATFNNQVGLEVGGPSALFNFKSALRIFTPPRKPVSVLPCVMGVLVFLLTICCIRH